MRDSLSITMSVIGYSELSDPLRVAETRLKMLKVAGCWPAVPSKNVVMTFE